MRELGRRAGGTELRRSEAVDIPRLTRVGYYITARQAGKSRFDAHPFPAFLPSLFESNSSTSPSVFCP